MNDTQSCYQFIKTMTTSKKQTSHRLCVFVRKKMKHLHLSEMRDNSAVTCPSYWEITQAWRTPITFDNFAIVLISLVGRMTVSFLLLWSLMLCMLFQAFFPSLLWHATAEHSPYFLPIQLWVPFFPKAVIPLNEECGLLEWVQNTHGLRNILTKIYK